MNPLALLLANPSPILRNRVLRELFGRNGDDDEVRENTLLAREDPLLTGLLKHQHSDGSWTKISPVNPVDFDPLVATGQALRLLDLLGFDATYDPAARGAEYLLSRQEAGGEWALRDGGEPESRGSYTDISLKTSLPLQGLAAIGLAEDPRCEKAYHRLMDQRLDDGAWPTGRAGSVLGYVAGYRRLAHSRWGCRSNTTSAVLALSRHPRRRASEKVALGLDHLLGRETRERKFLGWDSDRLLGLLPLKGFFTFFAQNDLLIILELCADLGANREDPRVESLAVFFEENRNERGLWETDRGEAAWFSFRILKALGKIAENRDWAARLPRTPFAPYSQRGRRY